MDRNPPEDCTEPHCPFVGYPHTRELVPNTDVRVHYAVDPVAQVIEILWIHSDNDPYPDEKDAAAIRATREAELEAQDEADLAAFEAASLADWDAEEWPGETEG